LQTYAVLLYILNNFYLNFSCLIGIDILVLKQNLNWQSYLKHVLALATLDDITQKEIYPKVVVPKVHHSPEQFCRFLPMMEGLNKAEKTRY